MGGTFKACQNVTFTGIARERVPDTKITKFYQETREEEVCAEGKGIDGAKAELDKVIAGRCRELRGNFRCKEAKTEGDVRLTKARSFWRALFDSMKKYNMKRDPGFL